MNLDINKVIEYAKKYKMITGHDKISIEMIKHYQSEVIPLKMSLLTADIIKMLNEINSKKGEKNG